MTGTLLPFRRPVVDTRSLEVYYQPDDGPENGWWYWFCGPGCIVKGGAVGPFNSEEDARSHACGL